jgi:O-antigen ligase
MANESFALSFDAPPRVERLVLPSIGFFALLLLVYVGFEPFAQPKTGALPNGEGDLLRQILYLLTFGLVIVTAFQRRGLGAMRVLPPLFVALQGWCVASALWATSPDVAFRRAVLEALLSFSVLMSIDTLGPERAFRYWRIVLAVILAVNWISIPLIDTAKHLPGEIDPGLVGDWRGLYNQKNVTGAVCTLTIILFLFTRNGTYNWIGWLVSLFALGFLVMTRSKTSLALVPVALLSGVAYRFAWRDGLSRAIFTVAAALLIVGAASASLFLADTIMRLLEDPTEFTGRTEIWQAYLAFAGDHPWLGAGFGTLADTGRLSPIHDYVSSKWVEAAGSSHNGYLQMLVMIGGVGFALGITALIIEPLARLWPLDYREPAFKSLLFALFVFFVAHNFMEPDLLDRDSPVWFAALAIIAGLRNPDKSLTLAA